MPIDGPVRTILDDLRAAVVFEKDERMKAPFEAKREAEARIQEAHRQTITLVKAAHAAGATKTMIAHQLGIQNLHRVSQLMKEAESL